MVVVVPEFATTRERGPVIRGFLSELQFSEAILFYSVRIQMKPHWGGHPLLLKPFEAIFINTGNTVLFDLGCWFNCR